MKKLTLIIALGLTTSILFAQKIKESELPAKVKAAFTKEFPKATEVEWEKEDANFEVGFDLNKMDYSVVYSAQGVKMETEVEIKASELPKEVMAYMNKNQAGKTITEAAKITDAKGVVTYETEIKGKEFIFDSKGALIKEKAKKEEKEDDDDDDEEDKD